MIAPDGEDAPAAQEVEVSLAVPVVEVLSACPPVCLVEADGLEHPDHLLVEMARMQGIALRLTVSEKVRDLEGRSQLQARLRGRSHPRTREIQGLLPGAIEMPQAQLIFYTGVPPPAAPDRRKQSYRYKYGRAAADTRRGGAGISPKTRGRSQWRDARPLTIFAF